MSPLFVSAMPSVGGDFYGGEKVTVKPLNFVVLPYRDRYFLESYGNAVRDLHMIQAVAGHKDVCGVSVFNRPVTLHERLLLRKSAKVGGLPHGSFPGVNWIDKTDKSPVAPLARRRWVAKAYKRWHEEISALRRSDAVNVLLDFTPLAKIDYNSLGFDVVWYDAIDNFTKHNRFSSSEVDLVKDKYLYVSQNADLITAVSAGALSAFDGSSQRFVLPNGLPRSAEVGIRPCCQDAYDFGFMGFITNKFDVSLIRKLSAMGYRTAIFGQVYDRETAKALASIQGVYLHGAFEYREAAGISTLFKVGLIPYLRSKLHDESPLKLYQYLSWGKPVLSSIGYEISSPFIRVYQEASDADLEDLCRISIQEAQDFGMRAKIYASVDDEFKWEFKIAEMIDRVFQIHRKLRQ